MEHMWKIKLLLMIFVVSISIFIPNVDAATWPKSTNDEDIAYIIDGFEIRLYDASLDENGNSKLNIENYNDRSPIHTIILDSNRFTINEEYRNDKLGGVSARLVNLNLSITKTEVEELIKEIIPSLADENEIYIGELVVNYRFTALPSSYTNYYNYSYSESIAAHMNNLNYQWSPISLNEPLSQVINIIIYGKDITENWDFVVYNSSIMSGVNINEYITNFVLFSQKEAVLKNNLSYEKEGKFIYMFHTMSNIEVLIDELRVEEEQGEVPDIVLPEDVIEEIKKPNDLEISKESEQVEQVVQVDNTSAAISGFIYLISIIVIIIGGIIIYKETKVREIKL